MTSAQDMASTLVWVITLASVALLAVAIWRQGRTSRREVERKCLACGYDLWATPDRCPECGEAVVPPEARVAGKLDLVALREDWPANPIDVRVPDPGEASVVVHETTHPVEADLLCQQLEARGVKAWSRDKRPPVLHGYQPPGPAVFHVRVYAGDADEAQGYVRRLRRSVRAAAPATEMAE